MSDRTTPPVVFIVGPTASGKSELALQLAEQSGAEICSMDAFQVYRGLDIGTGKLSESERRGIPHRLIDLVDPLESFTVADYLARATDVFRDLQARGKASIWVGGTGLYFRALRRGLSPVPASDPGLVEELSSRPLEKLREEVRACDPVWSAKADLNNPRRMIRALAVFRQTGRPLSTWHEIKGQPLITAGRAYLLQPATDVLKPKISRRIAHMWRQGWCEEVGGLLRLDGWRNSQSFQAIGYQAVAGFLEKTISMEECVEQINTQTWQYARRQMTWFRGEDKIEVFAGSSSFAGALGMLTTGGNGN